MIKAFLFSFFIFLTLRILLVILTNKIFPKVRNFLLYVIASDLILNFLNWFIIYPKPYHGFGFFIFLIKCFFTLSPATFLVYQSEKLSNKNNLAEILLLISVLFLIFKLYPQASGDALLKIFQSFYFTTYSYGIISFLRNLKEKISGEQVIIIFLLFAGLAEVILVTFFGLSGWWVLDIGNVIVYIITAGLSFFFKNRGKIMK